MKITSAFPENLEQIASLLSELGLPPLPAGLPLRNVLVCLQTNQVIGVVALEVLGLCGLVRSLAVAPSHAGAGVGRSLLESLLARAHELSLRDLYLLTEGAQGFLEELGFAPVSRESVPLAVRSTRQFREQCSETATVMHLPLATRRL